MTDHEKKFHGGGGGVPPWSCSKCGKSFTRRMFLRWHTHVAHPSRKRSPVSPRWSPRRSPRWSFNASVRRKSPVLPKKKGRVLLKCTSCPFSTNQKHKLTSHEWIHTGHKPFKCGQCDYATRQKSYLSVHEKTHSGEKSFKCQHCPRAFTSADGKKYHEKQRYQGPDGPNPHRCTGCCSGYASQRDLKAHQTKYHSEGDPSLPCGVCGALYRSQRSLKGHLRLKHGGSGQHPCPHCGLRYESPSLLAGHITRKHRVSREKVKVPKSLVFRPLQKEERDLPFGCSRCERRYNTRGGLSGHVTRAHSAGPPLFLCQECQLPYRTVAALRRHRRRKHQETGRMFDSDLGRGTNVAKSHSPPKKAEDGEGRLEEYLKVPFK